jgi:hypothetical protein
VPFGEVLHRQAYEQGYQIGVAQSVLTTWARVLRNVVPIYEDEELHRLFLQGLEKGFSNRQGEQIAARKAEWYQKNRERIVAKQRQQRRQRQTMKAHEALKHFSKLLPNEHRNSTDQHH